MTFFSLPECDHIAAAARSELVIPHLKAFLSKVSSVGSEYERPLRSRSRAIRLFWQLRMGEAAFLGRPWLAGPPGASLGLIRDYGEIDDVPHFPNQTSRIRRLQRQNP